MATVTTIYRSGYARSMGSSEKFKRPKVSIRGRKKVFILPITKTEVDHEGLALNYEEVNRPFNKPIIRHSNTPLRVIKLQCYFAAPMRRGDAGHLGEDIDMDSYIKNTLLQAASDPNAVVALSYGRLEQGSWLITDISLRTVKRNHRNNNTTVALADITLTERVHDTQHLSKPASSQNTAPKSSGGGGSSTKKNVKYTVKKGDTLSKIAASVCGSADHWPRIAETNNIKNPHLIYPGQKLTITC